MKLSIDCIRDVMLLIEEQPYGSEMRLNKLSQNLPQYDEEELQYTCLKLHEGGYIHAMTASYLGFAGPQLVSIQDLTYSGHQMLDTIRSDKVFADTKLKIAKCIGSASIDIISQVASSIALKMLGLN